MKSQTQPSPSTARLITFVKLRRFTSESLFVELLSEVKGIHSLRYTCTVHHQVCQNVHKYVTIHIQDHPNGWETSVRQTGGSTVTTAILLLLVDNMKGLFSLQKSFLINSFLHYEHLKRLCGTSTFKFATFKNLLINSHKDKCLYYCCLQTLQSLW